MASLTRPRDRRRRLRIHHPAVRTSGAWSHGYLWAPTSSRFRGTPTTSRSSVRSKSRRSSVASTVARRPLCARDRLGTAVRALNELVGSGVAAQIALAEFRERAERSPPGVQCSRPIRYQGGARLARQERELHFQPALAASLPALDSVDHTPRIAVLTAAVNQSVWSLGTSASGRPDLGRDDQHRPHGSARGLRRRLQHRRLAFGCNPGTNAADCVLARGGGFSAPVRTAAAS